MTTRAGSTVALVGGPESGKTTYLGAIVHALETDGLSHLGLRSLPDDATAYERLSEPLLDGAYPQRTKAERHALELPLRATRGGRVEEISLHMGDYDGEEVERLFKDRTQGFSPEWRARAEARGVLLFVRPDAMASLPRLRSHDAPTDRERMLALRTTTEKKPRARTRRRTEADPEAAFGAGIQDETRSVRVPAPDEPVRVPTALAVVELLQFLRHERGLEPGERPGQGEMRIAFLASAWDAVDPAWQRRGPAALFRERAPLLDDYLWSNHRPGDVLHFGLSSTAGDLSDERHRERYREDPHGFVVWSDASGRILRTRNIALPIEWALFGDEALAGNDVEVVPS
ncbi:TRAFAC clade GTPase domain-containing protein [Sorangium sp. So ce1097]|uniref:TRAFAC clade GTPase domain-containing protein n=1 Tax=Sorangium sp. So ce1097 TaxID=3133330 RepID=UPI003F647FE2